MANVNPILVRENKATDPNEEGVNAWLAKVYTHDRRIGNLKIMNLNWWTSKRLIPSICADGQWSFVEHDACTANRIHANLIFVHGILAIRPSELSVNAGLDQVYTQDKRIGGQDLTNSIWKTSKHLKCFFSCS